MTDQPTFPREATIKRCRDLLNHCDYHGKAELKVDLRDFRNLVEMSEGKENKPLGFILETGKLHPDYTVPVILHCPKCSERHIDEGDFETVAHHTHACQGCGFVWRPAKVNTHGVRFLPGYTNAKDA